MNRRSLFRWLGGAAAGAAVAPASGIAASVPVPAAAPALPVAAPLAGSGALLMTACQEGLFEFLLPDGRTFEWHIEEGTCLALDDMPYGTKVRLKDNPGATGACRVIHFYE